MGSWLLYNALVALPFALVALVLERAQRHRPALVHLAWMLVLARLVAPPLGALVPPRAAGAGALVSSTSGPALEVVGALSRAFGPNWSTWLTRGLEAGALAGLLVFLARELRHLRRAQRGVLRATLASEELAGRARSLAARLGVAPPGVRVLPGLSSPFVWGAWGARRALLVLPERRTADTVLTHELAHLARRDHAVAWLELVVLGLCWWNPLAWLARRRMALFAELSCDACVLDCFPAERARYARELVDAVDHADAARGVDALAREVALPRRAIGWSAVELELRLGRILRASDDTRRPASLLALGVFALVLSLPGPFLPSLARFRAALPSIPSGLDRRSAERSLVDADRQLALTPDDGDALDRRGRALMSLGRCAEAAAAFQRELAVGARPERALYNLACARARGGETQAALEALETALPRGVPREYLEEDDDLETLRGLEGFERLRPQRR